MRILLSVLLSLLFLGPAQCGEADVLKVTVKQASPGEYNFSVTIVHEDAGWDHYADKWDILDLDGNILGTRILHHPHDDEQPFTRSLSSVDVPHRITSVIVRAHDSVHGYGGTEMKVTLPK